MLAASQQIAVGKEGIDWMEQNPSLGERGGGAVVFPSPRPLPRGRAVLLAKPRGVREPGQEVKLPNPNVHFSKEMWDIISGIWKIS